MVDLAQLITSKKKASTGLNDIITLIYGDKKVGKSTFASHFPEPLFLDCEAGLRTVSDGEGNIPDHVAVHTWSQIQEVTEALSKDTGGYKTLIVDGLGELASYLIEHILLENGVSSLNEGPLAYGQGKGVVVREFRSWFQKLRALDMTIVLIAHDRVAEVEYNGVKFDRRIPLIDSSKMGIELWDALKPSINMILYANKVNTKEGVQHQMRTKGTQQIEAADPYGKLPEVMQFEYDQLDKALA